MSRRTACPCRQTALAQTPKILQIWTEIEEKRISFLSIEKKKKKRRLCIHKRRLVRRAGLAKNETRLDGCFGRGDQSVHLLEALEQACEGAVSRSGLDFVARLQPCLEDDMLGHDRPVLCTHTHTCYTVLPRCCNRLTELVCQYFLQGVCRSGLGEDIAQDGLCDGDRCPVGLGDVVIFADCNAGFLVGLDDAEQRHDAKLVIGEDDVSRGVELDKQVVAALGTAKVKHHHAVVAELAHVHQTPCADVLAQLQRWTVNNWKELEKGSNTFMLKPEGMLFLSRKNSVVWMRTPDSIRINTFSSLRANLRMYVLALTSYTLTSRMPPHLFKNPRSKRERSVDRLLPPGHTVRAARPRCSARPAP